MAGTEFILISRRPQVPLSGDRQSEFITQGRTAINEAIRLAIEINESSDAVTYLSRALPADIRDDFALPDHLIKTDAGTVLEDFSRYANFAESDLAHYSRASEFSSAIPGVALLASVAAIREKQQGKDPQGLLMIAINGADQNRTNVVGQEASPWLYVAEAHNKCGYETDKAFDKAFAVVDALMSDQTGQLSTRMNLQDIACLAASRGNFDTAGKAIDRLRALQSDSTDESYRTALQITITECLAYLGVKKLEASKEPDGEPGELIEKSWQDELYEFILTVTELSPEQAVEARKLFDSFLEAVAGNERFTWIAIKEYRDEQLKDRVAFCLFGDIFSPEPPLTQGLLRMAKPGVSNAFANFRKSAETNRPFDLYYVDKLEPSPDDLENNYAFASPLSFKPPLS